jgi:hypothetical protein
MAETRIVHLIGSEGRGRGLGRWLALVGVAIAVAVIVELVVSWPSGARTSLSENAPAAGSAAARPALRARACDPIFGGGIPHQVRSVAGAGAPVGCGAAHSVLLAALNGGGASVGGWHCVRRPNERTLEACTSGGRRVAARD